MVGIIFVVCTAYMYLHTIYLQVITAGNFVMPHKRNNTHRYTHSIETLVGIIIIIIITLYIMRPSIASTAAVV